MRFCGFIQHSPMTVIGVADTFAVMNQPTRSALCGGLLLVVVLFMMYCHSVTGRVVSFYFSVLLFFGGITITTNCQFNYKKLIQDSIPP